MKSLTSETGLIYFNWNMSTSAVRIEQFSLQTDIITWQNFAFTPLNAYSETCFFAK